MLATPHTKALFYINLGYLRPFFDFLRSKAEPLEDYLCQLGIVEDDLGSADLRVPAEGINGLFEMAEQRLDDPFVGLHVGQSMQLNHLGIIGLLIMSCRYAREVFDLHARYQNLAGNSLNTQYHENAEQCYLESRMTTGHKPFSRHSFDFVFGGWWNLKRSMVDKLHKPLRIEFPYPEPADVGELESFFDAPMSFGHEVLRVRFEAKYLDFELMPADSDLKQMIEAQVRQRLQQLQGMQADANPYLARVKQIIAQRLAYGAPSIDGVAAELEVSARTVQRQLDQHGSAYSALLDLVRRDLAGRYIDNQDLSLLDVAMMLGFSEQSSFQRAFKRWYEQTPGEYRREHVAA